MARGLSRFVRFEPAPGMPYSQALRSGDPSFSRLRQIALGIGGAMLACCCCSRSRRGSRGC